MLHPPSSHPIAPAWVTALWAGAHKCGSNGLHVDSPCAASMWGVLLQNKHPMLSSHPPRLQINEIPQQTPLALCLWVTSTSKLVAQQLQCPLEGG